MKKVLGLMLTALLISVGTANATPSTQIWIPSTDIQAFGTFHLGVDNYSTFFKKAKDGGHAAPVDVGLTAGIAEFDIFKFEAGIDLIEPTDDPLYFNFKAGVGEDAIAAYVPAIALGVYGVGTNSNTTNYNIFYAELAKNISFIGRFTAGFFFGNDKLLVDGSGKKANTGLLLSWDRTMAEINDKLWLSVDYQGGKSSLGALSFGMAWKFAPNASVIFGYDMFNDKNVAGENTFTVQTDFDF